MNQMLVGTFQFKPDNPAQMLQSALSSPQVQNLVHIWWEFDEEVSWPLRDPQCTHAAMYSRIKVWSIHFPIPGSRETDMLNNNLANFQHSNVQYTAGDKTLTSLGCLTFGRWLIWGQLLQRLFGLVLGAATSWMILVEISEIDKMNFSQNHTFQYQNGLILNDFTEVWKTGTWLWTSTYCIIVPSYDLFFICQVFKCWSGYRVLTHNHNHVFGWVHHVKDFQQTWMLTMAREKTRLQLKFRR